MKRFVIAFIGFLAAVAWFTYQLPTQITDPPPEPLHLKQDEIDMSEIAPAAWDKPTVLEELDSPVVLSVRSSPSSSEPLKTREPFKPHFKKASSSEPPPSSASSLSSAVSTYCTDNDYLKIYTESGARQAAIAARNKLCRQ